LGHIISFMYSLGVKNPFTVFNEMAIVGVVTLKNFYISKNKEVRILYSIGKVKTFPYCDELVNQGEISSSGSTIVSVVSA
jgi:hypothetical protein